MSGDGGDDDAGADDLQTVMWTRALAGLDRHNVEGCEDLLDTYFTQARMRPCGPKSKTKPERGKKLRNAGFEV